MNPPVFISSATTAGSGGTCVAAFPSGLQAGDLMIAYHMAAVTNQTLTPPANWTPAGAETVGAGETEVTYRVADAADITTGNATWTATNSISTTVVIVIYRGVDQITPVISSAMGGTPSLTPTHALDASGVAPTAPTVGIYHISRNSDITWASNPSGWDSRINQFSGGFDFILMDKAMAAGSYGTLTTTSSSSTRANFGVLALNPPPASVIAVRVGGAFVNKPLLAKESGVWTERIIKDKSGGSFN